MVDLNEYDDIRAKAQLFYSKQTKSFSPALQNEVLFTAEGFGHIVYKRARSERDRATQIIRFKLLERAIELISLSTTIQEYEEIHKLFEIKRRKKRLQVEKKIEYWGLIAIIKNRKIKVIIRKVGNGSPHFWSIIPAWTTNKYRDTKFISTMKGQPEED